MKTTTNLDEIRSWAAHHHGTPEIVSSPQAGHDVPQLRINFPGKDDDIFLPPEKKRRSVSWDEFFHEFEGQQLAFTYEDQDHFDDPSLAYHFMKRTQPHSSEVTTLPSLDDIPE